MCENERERERRGEKGEEEEEGRRGGEGKEGGRKREREIIPYNCIKIHQFLVVS